MEEKGKEGERDEGREGGRKRGREKGLGLVIEEKEEVREGRGRVVGKGRR